jgi:hypothetical protein
MAPNDFPRNTPTRPMRSPVASAVILLAFYIAMYLAVAAVVRVIDPASADDVASDSPSAPLASAPAAPAADVDAYAAGSRTPGRTDTAPNCRFGAKEDLRCAAD